MWQEGRRITSERSWTISNQILPELFISAALQIKESTNQCTLQGEGDEAAVEQVPAHRVWENVSIWYKDRNCHLVPLLATVLNKKHSTYHGRQKWLKALEINSLVLVWYLQGNAAKALTSDKAKSVWISDVQHNPLVKSNGESSGTNSFLLGLQTRRKQERDEWMNKWFVYFFSLKC